MWMAIGLAALALAGPATAGAQSTTGVVRGRVALAIQGVRLADAGPLVVRLETTDGRLMPPPSPAAVTMHQRDARLRQRSSRSQRGKVWQWKTMMRSTTTSSPSQSPTASISVFIPRANRGPSHLRYPGVVRTYCSIHESMSGTIFVSPSPFFALVGGSGEFELRSVPAGIWRLRTWCERLPSATRDLRVLAGRTVVADLSIAQATP